MLSLLQRTMLTGWLLLIDDTVPFTRLFCALFVVLIYLAFLLKCRPYKSQSDWALAVAVQCLFVWLYLGFLAVCPPPQLQASMETQVFS